MDTTNKDEVIKTVPDGVWEGTRPNKPDKQNIRTDIQDNGYPKKQDK